MTVNTSITSSTANLTAQQVDPNETGWNEVKDLGLEPEPTGMVADDDAQQE